MEYRNLELNIVSAQDLKNVNLFSKMNVYAVVSISGDPRQKKHSTVKTPVHKHAGNHPTWNFSTKFSVNHHLARHNRLFLRIDVRCHRSLLGGKQIGRVEVPIKELLDQCGDGTMSLQYVNYQVSKPSGKPRGVVSLSYKFGAKFTVAYPPAPALVSVPYEYPTPEAQPYDGVGFFNPPPQLGYGFGYPGQAAGYGYPGQMSHGFGGPNRGNFGVGMGAGLMGGAIGGLLLGDMVSDANASDAAGFGF